MKKRNIGFLYLLFGFLFLFSPDVVIFDVLPDFIGYILIVVGLSRLADIDERAHDARQSAKKLLALSAVKFILSLYLPSLQKTNLLLVVFSLAILDIILVVPFLKDLFYSLDYTASRQGVMLDSKKTDTVRTLFMSFAVIKDVLMVLPSAVSLVDPAETGSFDEKYWAIDFSALFNVLTVISFLFMIVFGIYTAFFVLRFFIGLLRNRELLEKLFDNYSRTVLQVPSRLITKGALQIRALLVCAIIFFADFYVDFIDVLPTAIGFILLVAASRVIQRRFEVNTSVFTVLSLFGAVSSAAAFFYRAYWYKELGKVVEYAFSQKQYSLILAAIPAVLTILSFALLLRALVHVGKEHGVQVRAPKAIVCAVFSGLVAIGAFVLFAHPEKNAAFVFPAILAAIAFIAVFYDFLKELTDEIFYKYKNKDF